MKNHITTYYKYVYRLQIKIWGHILFKVTGTLNKKIQNIKITIIYKAEINEAESSKLAVRSSWVSFINFIVILLNCFFKLLLLKKKKWLSKNVQTIFSHCSTKYDSNPRQIIQNSLFFSLLFILFADREDDKTYLCPIKSFRQNSAKTKLYIIMVTAK